MDTKYLFLFFSISFIAFNCFSKSDCFPESTELLDSKSKVKYISKKVLQDLRSNSDLNNESVFCLLKSIEISQENGFGLEIVKAYDLIGRIYLSLGKFDSAKSFILEGLKVSDSIQNVKCQARMLNSLGNVESERGNVELAIEYYLQSKKAWSLKNAQSKMIGLDINIASLYLDQKDYEKASFLFNESLKKAKEINKSYLTNLCYINLGVLNEKIKNYRESLFFFEKILEQPKSEVPKALRQKALASASSSSLKLGDRKTAEKYFIEALPVKDSRGKLELYVSWADGLSFLSHHDEALNKYKLGLEFAKELNDAFLIAQIYEKIAQQYRNINDYKLGWEYFEKFKSINDTLISKEKQALLNQVVSEYTQREKELRIEALEKQRRSDRIIKIISIILMIFLVITIVVIYSRYKLKKNTTEKLTEQNGKLQFQNKQIKSREILLRKNKQEIEQKNELLARHTEKIDAQNKELQRYNNDLEQFAYSVSHDLRAPIRSIHSFLHLIQRNISNKDAIEEYLSIAQENSQLLANLLEDLLTYTRVGRSELEPVLVDLNQTIQKVIKNLHYAVEQNNAVVEISELPVIKGFPADMYLLFQNIIQNAIKFRHPSRTPYIKISSKDYQDYFLILVSDNGIGIKDEYKKQIFRVFQRIDNQKEGTGIGLAIVKKIMDYSNGEIYLDSEEGIGTTFYLRFSKKLNS